MLEQADAEDDEDSPQPQSQEQDFENPSQPQCEDMPDDQQMSRSIRAGADPLALDMDKLVRHKEQHQQFYPD